MEAVSTVSEGEVGMVGRELPIVGNHCRKPIL